MGQASRGRYWGRAIVAGLLAHGTSLSLGKASDIWPVQLQLATESIGVATMQPDGTIVLRLRAAGPNIVGHALLAYPPNHPEYSEILRHLGGMKPGETKSVRPWPDQ